VEAPLGAYRHSLPQVHDLVRHRLCDGAPVYARELVEHFPLDRGQGLRPSLVIASSRCTKVRSGFRSRLPKRVNIAAAVIELVHNASLLHDDVVDGAATRRHAPTINECFGTKEAVLLGDYFLSRALQLVGEFRSAAAMRSFSRLIGDMVDGEILELQATATHSFSKKMALDIVYKKTGTLVGEACFLGALAGGFPADRAQHFKQFGLEAGCAYQIADDLLDISACAKDLGKDTGGDFEQRKPTLPLVFAFEAASSQTQRSFLEGSPKAKHSLARILSTPDIRKRCLDQAHSAADHAIAALSRAEIEGPDRRALESFATFAWKRASRP